MHMMGRRQSVQRKGGARRKAAGGLTKALFIRVDDDLLKRLDKLREQQSKRKPGIVLSRADVARSILWDAVQRGDEGDEQK